MPAEEDLQGCGGTVICDMPFVVECCKYSCCLDQFTSLYMFCVCILAFLHPGNISGALALFAEASLHNVRRGLVRYARVKAGLHREQLQVKPSK